MNPTILRIRKGFDNSTSHGANKVGSDMSTQGLVESDFRAMRCIRSRVRNHELQRCDCCPMGRDESPGRLRADRGTTIPAMHGTHTTRATKAGAEVSSLRCEARGFARLRRARKPGDATTPTQGGAGFRGKQPVHTLRTEAPACASSARRCRKLACHYVCQTRVKLKSKINISLALRDNLV